MSDLEFFAAAAISGWLLVPVVYCLGFWLGGRYALNARRKLRMQPVRRSFVPSERNWDSN